MGLDEDFKIYFNGIELTNFDEQNPVIEWSNMGNYKRIRQGKNGLYYTNGKLDKCEYNMRFAPLHVLAFEEFKEILKYDVSRAFEALYMGLQGILFFCLFLFLPIIRVILEKIRLKDLKVDGKYDKNYYEVIKEYNYEDK